MSIIYDALTKAQEIRQLPTPKSNKKLFVYYAFGILIIFSVFIVFVFAYKRSQPIAISKNETKKIIVMEEAQPKTPHILNGIFLSNSQQIAMIDQAYYHIGDKIDGMKIISMNANKVVLKDNNHIITLSMLN